MSDKYTPTTYEVCLDFAWVDGYPYEGAVDPIRKAAFNRWLTEHDAATRTAALEEAAVIAEKTISYQYMVTSSGHIDAARAIRAAKVAES